MIIKNKQYFFDHNEVHFEKKMSKNSKFNKLFRINYNSSFSSRIPSLSSSASFLFRTPSPSSSSSPSRVPSPSSSGSFLLERPSLSTLSRRPSLSSSSSAESFIPSPSESASPQNAAVGPTTNKNKRKMEVTDLILQSTRYQAVFSPTG